MKGSNSTSIKPPLPASVNALDFSPFDTLALALLDEAPFHLRHHAEHGQHDVAHIAASGDMRVKHGDERLSLLALVYEVQDIPCITPEPVEARYHQLVARPQELDDSRELCAPLAAGTRHFL